MLWKSPAREWSIFLYWIEVAKSLLTIDQRNATHPRTFIQEHGLCLPGSVRLCGYERMAYQGLVSSEFRGPSRAQLEVF